MSPDDISIAGDWLATMRSRARSWVTMGRLGYALLAAISTLFLTSLTGYREYRTDRWAILLWPGAVVVGVYPTGPADFGRSTGVIDLRPARFRLYWPSYWRPRWFARPPDHIWLVPLWIPIAVLGLVMALTHRRARKTKPGQCHKCAYDLTGNISGVCPECGTPVARESAEP